MTTHSEPSNTVTFPCPRCKKTTHLAGNAFKPFCSERCKLIDLGAWANEEYKVAAAEDTPMGSELE